MFILRLFRHFGGEEHTSWALVSISILSGQVRRSLENTNKMFSKFPPRIRSRHAISLEECSRHLQLQSRPTSEIALSYEIIYSDFPCSDKECCYTLFLRLKNSGFKIGDCRMRMVKARSRIVFLPPSGIINNCIPAPGCGGSKLSHIEVRAARTRTS